MAAQRSPSPLLQAMSRRWTWIALFLLVHALLLSIRTWHNSAASTAGWKALYAFVLYGGVFGLLSMGVALAVAVPTLQNLPPTSSSLHLFPEPPERRYRDKDRIERMKKIGRRVHPTPLAAAAATPWEQLAVLPPAILTLVTALTAEEQEVLAYLLSGCVGGGADGGGGRGKWKEERRWRRQQHPPELGCGCFGCYKSFWARWDASPNSHLIHRIIDAVEETLECKKRAQGKGRRRRSGRGGGGRKGGDAAEEAKAKAEEEELFEVEGKGFTVMDGGHVADNDDDEEEDVDDGEDDGEKRDGGVSIFGKSRQGLLAESHRIIAHITGFVFKFFHRRRHQLPRSRPPT